MQPLAMFAKGADDDASELGHQAPCEVSLPLPSVYKSCKTNAPELLTRLNGQVLNNPQPVRAPLALHGPKNSPKQHPATETEVVGDLLVLEQTTMESQLDLCQGIAYGLGFLRRFTRSSRTRTSRSLCPKAELVSSCSELSPGVALSRQGVDAAATCQLSAKKAKVTSNGHPMAV
eukprot:5127226-Amphidinium_carterae.2